MDWLSDTVEGPGFFPSLYSAIWFLSLGLYLRGCKMAAAVARWLLQFQPSHVDIITLIQGRDRRDILSHS